MMLMMEKAKKAKKGVKISPKKSLLSSQSEAENQHLNLG
jgi:hypothetical protein